MKNKQGSILVFILLTMSLLIISVLGMMRSTIVEQQSAHVTDDSANAFQVADSGIEYTFRKITKEFVKTISDMGSCSNGVVTRNLAHSGLYHLSFYEENGDKMNNCTDSTAGIRSVKSIGIFDSAMRAIHAHVMIPLDVTDDLIAQWTFDDGSGHVVADAVDSGSHDGYIHKNSYDWVTNSLRGTYALKLNGSTSYISVHDDSDFDFSLTDDYTISLWVKSSTTSGTDAVFTKSYDKVHRYGLLRNGSKWRFCIKDTSNENCMDGNVVIDHWQHIVIEKDSDSDVKLYIDGVEKDSLIVLDSEESGAFVIGRAEGSSAGNYDGIIDDMRIYNRVLTEDEIIILCRQRTDSESCE